MELYTTAIECKIISAVNNSRRMKSLFNCLQAGIDRAEMINQARTFIWKHKSQGWCLSVQITGHLQYWCALIATYLVNVWCAASDSQRHQTTLSLRTPASRKAANLHQVKWPTLPFVPHQESCWNSWNMPKQVPSCFFYPNQKASVSLTRDRTSSWELYNWDPLYQVLWR